MEHGPVPPHERTWRHPSELAADEQVVLRAVTAPSTSRAVAMAAGSLGLVAIAVLVLTITPSRDQRQVALSATTAPAAVRGPGTTVSASVSRPRGVASAHRTEPVASAPATVDPAIALATPIGTGRYAIVSRAAAPDAGQPAFDVILPSGRTTLGQVVDRSTDAVLVELDDAEAGHSVAAHAPDARAFVTVMSDPPITVAFADVDTLEVAEGTPVVDERGELVGLCTSHERGVRLIEIDPSITAAQETAAAADETDDGDEPDPTAGPTAAGPTLVDSTTAPGDDENDSSDDSDTSQTSEPSTTATGTVTTGEIDDEGEPDDIDDGDDGESDHPTTTPESDPDPTTAD